MSVRQFVLQRRAWRVRKTPGDQQRQEGRALLQDLARMLRDMEAARDAGRDVGAGERRS